jgi:hypothetical protein
MAFIVSTSLFSIRQLDDLNFTAMQGKRPLGGDEPAVSTLRDKRSKLFVRNTRPHAVV